MLPLHGNGWSVSWSGQQGFVRTTPLEGSATDSGSGSTPPVSLSLLLQSARIHASFPEKITVYPTTPDAAPDAAQWQHQLGLPVTVGALMDWRVTATNPVSRLIQTQRRWNTDTAFWGRLRPAGWIILATLAVHLIASGIDWMLLAGAQRSLRNDIEMQFRRLFPDAIAVVDPALQMRRKLTEARHAAGLADGTDFLPLLDKASPALKSLPSDALRVMTYDQGRLSVELRVQDAGTMQLLINDLQRAGLSIEVPANALNSVSPTTIISIRES
jgi:general secretion pathway protein L